MTGSPILLTRSGMAQIAQSDAPGGDLHLSRSTIDDFYLVEKVEVANEVTIGVGPDRVFEALSWAADDYRGQWLTGIDESMHLRHLMLAGRPGSAFPWTDFTALVPQVRNPKWHAIPLITHVPHLSKAWADVGVPHYAAWHVSKDGVSPVPLHVEPEQTGVWRLDPQWPVADLQGRRVAVVGVGSIGGRVAESLAAYGVGTIDLVDPDRLLWHNQVRHVLGSKSVGRGKARAMKASLEDRWPESHLNAWQWNVVDEAHLLRGLLPHVDAVVCAADGIAPRRVVSHLARRAGVPAIQACVLADGAIGEVIRFRPGRRFGCLLCQRADLITRGAIDAEADQELDYGTGVSHKPMTAVGPDLHLVAHLTAKMTVATILESLHGDERHHLPGESAVIGLRPSGEFAAPFDVENSAEVQWTDLPPPRPDCPTCAP